jgi:dehydroquinase class II
MKKILVINGPNLNMLGIREPEIYGIKTYEDLCREIKKYAKKLKIEVDTFQSNHEGELIGIIQKAYGRYYGIIINPGAYTHTSIAILDALKAVGIRTIEVHLTDIIE